MRRTIDGTLLDGLQLWGFIALLTLFAYLMWGGILVQNHYYFATTPFTYEGHKVP